MSKGLRAITGSVVLAFVLLATAIAPGVAQQKVAITLWDQFGYAGPTAAGPAMDVLIERFQKENPNVAVVRTVAPSIGIRETLRLARAAGKGPDVAYTWPAASVLASYARAGKLADLTPYMKKFGWNWLDSFFIGRNSYKGKLYGMPMERDLMGVYYNKDLFAKHGVKVPTTYQEFLEAADTLKKAGVIPIAFGNRDRWPATNTMSLFLGLTAGRQKEEEVLFGTAKWTRPEFRQAAEAFVDWAKRGYFPEGFNGIGYDEANALFFQGRAAMNITGTWVLHDIIRGSKFDLGVFMLPSIVAGVPPGTMTGEGSQWEISATATKAVRDASATFVNFMVSPANRRTWAEKGFSVNIGAKAADVAGWNVAALVKSYYEQGEKTQKSNFYDLHTTVPESVTQVLYARLQEMLGRQITPVQFLQAIQSAWEEAVARGERWVPR